MNKVKKVFAKMIKNNSKDKCSVFYTSYDNARELVKMLCAMPDSYIGNITLTCAEYDGYDGLFLVNYSDENEISAQKAVFENGKIARSDGEYDNIYLDCDFITKESAQLYDVSENTTAKLI